MQLFATIVGHGSERGLLACMFLQSSKRASTHGSTYIHAQYMCSSVVYAPVCVHCASLFNVASTIK